MCLCFAHRSPFLCLLALSLSLFLLLLTPFGVLQDGEVSGLPKGVLEAPLTPIVTPDQGQAEEGRNFFPQTEKLRQEAPPVLEMSLVSGFYT